ncbi:amidohydrolase family protein [Rossellomorea arthrocnemi]|uniref:amidohydrolase family protein n=1 Tax=Rossellomorea arthrocnemi TaxID=2769542 RepID=UPI00191AA783|nr:amidohydrolase family protein [Rossellomorea arthrocnemi]
MKGAKYYKWDVHHHIVPDFYVNEMKDMGISVARIKWPKWDANASIKMMNSFHIKKAFVSLSTPGVFFKNLDYSQKLNRQCNEYIAKMIEEYPDRFGGFGSVTLPDVTSALQEAEYALDTLNLDGIALMSNVNGHYLGDEAYKPFYEEMNRRETIIYVHPNEVPGKTDHRFLNPLYLWQNDTTKTIIDFIYSGYHRKYPNIRWIFSHGGGIIAPLFPLLVEELSKENPNIAEELKVWKKQVFLDTASKAYDDQIPYLLEFSDPQHVLFGSDIGWGNKTAVSEIEKSYAALDDKVGLTEQQIEDIFMGNAKRLFSRESVPVQKDTKAPYSKPPFGVGQQRVQYHCHSEEEAVSLIASGDYDRVLLSFDRPEVWRFEVKDKQAALREYNDTVAKFRSENPQKLGAFCVIDPTSPSWSIAEIDRAINELNLDGVSLTIDIFNTSFTKLMDEQLIQKIGSIDKPVLIHPRISSGIPLISENQLETLYFIAKAFYLDIYKKYWLNTPFILTHTGGALQYLAQPFNILYYLSPKISAPSMLAFMWDSYVIHKPKGYMLLNNTISE